MTPDDPLIRWLFSLQGPALKWDLETAAAFCAWLGHPDRAFPSVHVAGTNGKGSVAAMIEAIQRAAGRLTGLYTSPHLVAPEERIRVGGADIDPARFRAAIAELRDEAAAALAAGALPRHPSFFEMMTAAAFRAFARRGVDVAVIETGLGGRLDATNVVTPRLSIITTIGLDHVKTLGGTLSAIASEKAGIVKPGVPVLGGWIARAPRAVIDGVARERGSVVHWAADELRVRRAGEGFDLVTPERTYRGLRCALPGPHQFRNAALAVRASELLAAAGLPVEPGHVARGLAAVRWPGRLECVVVGDPGGGATTVRLDGAHNVEGARALARALDTLPRPARRVLVFGVTEGRDAARLLAPLLPHVDEVLVTKPGIVKAVEPEVACRGLAAAWPGLPLERVDDVAECLARAIARAADSGPAEVLVAGSLYLVGDARRVLLGLDGTGHPSRETQLAPARENRP